MFEEVNFLRKRWKIHATTGFSSTMPMFNYVLEEVKYKPKMPQLEDIMYLYTKIFNQM